MKHYLFILQLMTSYSVCYSYTYYKCTYISTRPFELTTKTCLTECCEHDCCPEKPFDGKLLAIILCCISIPVIVILACVCVCVRRRRRRLAERQARNCEVAARDLTTLFILSSLRQQHDTQTASAVNSSLADPPRYDDVVKGQS